MISRTSIIGYLSSLISINTRHSSIKCQANLEQTSESSQKNLKNQNVNRLRSLVRGWRGAGYVATSHLDVDKPGDNMERRPQELLSTRQVVLARQLTSAVLHVVWRQWRNAVIIMQTVETQCQRWKKTQTTSIMSTFLQIRGCFFFFINCLQISQAKCLGIAPVIGRRFWSDHVKHT